MPARWAASISSGVSPSTNRGGRIGVAADDAGERIDALADDFGAHGSVVAEAAGGEALPEAEVREFYACAALHVPRGQPKKLSARVEGIEQRGHAGQHDTAEHLQRLLQLGKVVRDECLEGAFRVGAPETMAPERFEEDGAVGAAVEAHAGRGLFDPGEAGEHGVDRAAARAMCADERHVDVEEQKARHAPMVSRRLARDAVAGFATAGWRAWCCGSGSHRA